MANATTPAAFEGGTGLTRRLDGWLLTVIAALCAFGLVMVYSASTPLGLIDYDNPNYFFERQAVCLIVGLAGLVFTARWDYHNLRRYTGPMVLFTVAALVLVLVPHIGTEVNGSRRWFMFGPISIQPSEIATLVAIVALARWLSDRGPAIATWRGVRDYLVLVSILEFLILLEKDLGTAIVVGVITITMLGLAGARKHHMALVMALAAGAGYGMILLESYRTSRVACFQNPFADPLACGFQQAESLMGLGSGGWFGVGLGKSVEKFLWLPEAHTDFIFAIIGEELGLIATIGVVVAFLFLAWRGTRAAMRAPDSFGALMAGGLVAWIMIQAFINIGAVTDLIPTVGLPLPFISYGGSSLIMTLIGVGVLCNISAQGHRQGQMKRASADGWRRRGPAQRTPAGGTIDVIGRRTGVTRPAAGANRAAAEPTRPLTRSSSGQADQSTPPSSHPTAPGR